MRKGTSLQLRRGGAVAKNQKIRQEHVEYLVDLLNVNSQFSLKELARKLLAEFNVSVSHQTIARHLEGRMISLKSVHYQPEAANNLTNKALRHSYVQDIMQATGSGKYVVYIDESNVNLFLRRSQGRAPVGSRAVVKLPSSKGNNIHMIGALTQLGLISFQRRRGSYKHEQFNAWLNDLLQSLLAQGIQSNNVVIVMDNAPCHARAEQVIGNYPGASILRLAPYSPMLNPIESAWSDIKAQLKDKEAASLAEVLAGNNNGLTQTEFRLRFVERLIDEARQAVTTMKCMRFVNHTQTFFADALALKDMPVGL